MRLDQRLVEMGLAPSRARAQALIKAGAVSVDGAVAEKASREVGAGVAVTVVSERAPRWVSRAGDKLAHALEAFDLSPDGAVVLDVGASTGGFTQVCLTFGAARVYALDVGRDQLHPSLRDDTRVREISGVNAKDVDASHIPEPVDWLVADVSFISLTKALPAPLALATRTPTPTAVVLVKPQFEVGRARIGKGGVVRDLGAQQDAVSAIRGSFEAQGWSVLGSVESPILGGDGNREFLLAAQRR